MKLSCNQTIEYLKNHLSPDDIKDLYAQKALKAGIPVDFSSPEFQDFKDSVWEYLEHEDIMAHWPHVFEKAPEIEAGYYVGELRKDLEAPDKELFT